jgi:hypothetical protein
MEKLPSAYSTKGGIEHPDLKGFSWMFVIAETSEDFRKKAFLILCKP